MADHDETHFYYGQAQASASKFDYFVTGGAGATLAVMLKEVHASDPWGIILFRAALILLAASLGAGLLHLFWNTECDGIAADMKSLESGIRRFDNAFRENRHYFEVETGKTRALADLPGTILWGRAERRRLIDRLGRLDNRITISMWVRNGGLILAFGALIGWRFLQP